MQNIEALMEETNFDIVIIGAGTAGMTAAIYAARAGKTVLLLEEAAVGGQIINALNIENYPAAKEISGFDFSMTLLSQVQALGVSIKYEKALKISEKSGEKSSKIVSTAKNSYFAKAIIIASGLKKREIGLENEKKLIGKGISYCATCDGRFFKGKKVAVYGGGNTAIEDAIFLSDYCEEVFVITRSENFRADKNTLETLKKRANVSFLPNFTIKSLGENEEKLESITLSGTKAGNSEKILPISALFVAIGQIPQNEAFKEILQLDESGFIKTDENCFTLTDGIFAAGDCRTKSVRQLVTAASDGAIAALSAVKYINEFWG